MLERQASVSEVEKAVLPFKRLQRNNDVLDANES